MERADDLNGTVNPQRMWGGRAGALLRSFAGVVMAGSLGGALFSVVIQEVGERKVFGEHRHDFLRSLGRVAGRPEDGARTLGLQLAMVIFALIAGGALLVDGRLPSQVWKAALVLAPLPFLAWGAVLCPIADSRLNGPDDGWFALSTSSRVAPMIFAGVASFVAVALVVRVTRVTALADWWRPDREGPEIGVSEPETDRR